MALSSFQKVRNKKDNHDFAELLTPQSDKPITVLLLIPRKIDFRLFKLK
jgi:hypothetical protein